MCNNTPEHLCVFCVALRENHRQHGSKGEEDAEDVSRISPRPLSTSSQIASSAPVGVASDPDLVRKRMQAKALGEAGGDRGFGARSKSRTNLGKHPQVDSTPQSSSPQVDSTLQSTSSQVLDSSQEVPNPVTQFDISRSKLEGSVRAFSSNSRLLRHSRGM